MSTNLTLIGLGRIAPVLVNGTPLHIRKPQRARRGTRSMRRQWVVGSVSREGQPMQVFTVLGWATRGKGFRVFPGIVGPLPNDTAFAPEFLAEFAKLTEALAFIAGKF